MTYIYCNISRKYFYDCLLEKKLYINATTTYSALSFLRKRNSQDKMISNRVYTECQARLIQPDVFCFLSY